jgi:hypothetical protein
MTRIEYEVDLRRMLCQKGKYAKAQSKLKNTVSSALLQKKGPLVYEAWIFFFTKHEKKGRCFFAEGSKTVCI